MTYFCRAGERPCPLGPPPPAGSATDTFLKTDASNFYRPQRSCKGYVFTPVCLSTGGSASVHAGIPPSSSSHSRPPSSRHPRSRHPLGADNPPERTPPWSRPLRSRHPHPLEQTPLEQTPLEQTPPSRSRPPQADGYCCGRYASYWNAFLFVMCFKYSR